MYCDFIFTGKAFENKKIYKCQYCGLEAGLDDPNTQVLCFKKNLDLHKAQYQQIESLYPNKPDPIKNLDNISNEEIDILQKEMEQSQANIVEEHEYVLCSNEEIQQRMDICNKCEYYRDDACMLCGCRVVREKNYQNKLANKNASCPDNRWGPIKD